MADGIWESYIYPHNIHYIIAFAVFFVYSLW